MGTVTKNKTSHVTIEHGYRNSKYWVHTYLTQHKINAFEKGWLTKEQKCLMFIILMNLLFDDRRFFLFEIHHENYFEDCGPIHFILTFAIYEKKN